jgi:ssDNA-binding Zn-finger/Zn-ribbon topoisomerase 1
MTRPPDPPKPRDPAPYVEEAREVAAEKECQSCGRPLVYLHVPSIGMAFMGCIDCPPAPGAIVSDVRFVPLLDDKSYLKPCPTSDYRESVTLAPMTFHLSRSKCPHCGGEVTVELSRVEPVGGKVVAMPGGPKP